MRERIKDILLESIQVKEEILRNQIGQIAQIAQLMIDCLKKDGKVIVFGNGGSASDSQHIAAELVGRFKKDRSALAAISLTTNTSILTSLANDYGYEHWIETALDFYADAKDMVILISSSGQSANIVNAALRAKKLGLGVITLSGFREDNSLKKLGDINFWVNRSQYNIIETVHQAWLLAVVDQIAAGKEME